MAFTIPPWLNPPNFLGAMESGASLGLRKSSQAASELESAGRLNLAQEAQDDSVSEAGDRLRLAYSQLASQEKLASANSKMRLDQQNAAMQLRQQQADSIDEYRSQMVQNAQDRLKQHTNPDPFVPTSMDLAGRHLIQLSPNRYSDVTQDPSKASAFKPNPVDVKQLDLVAKNIAQMEKELGASTDPAEKNQLGQALQGARAQMEALRSKFIQSASAGAQLSTPAGPGAETTTGTAAPASPFKEGQMVRSKKDPSKVFRIQNGVPVPVEQPTESAGASLSAHDPEEDGGDDGY